MVRVLKKLDPDAPHEILLVLDATTGQNARSQVETFLAMVPVTGLVVTKLDGTARGGVVVALAAPVRPAGARARRRRGHRRSAAVRGAGVRRRAAGPGHGVKIERASLRRGGEVTMLSALSL